LSSRAAVCRADLLRNRFYLSGLERLGWLDSRNVQLDIRFTQVGGQRQQVLAKELVDLKPDVILSDATPVTAAFQRESRAIPIVFVNVSDPIGSGFVTSLARPGGNITGLLLYEAGVTGKWLAMLKEIAPSLANVAFIADARRHPTINSCWRQKPPHGRSELALYLTRF